MTNALNIALLLEQAAVAGRIAIIVSGGTVRPLQHSLVNPYATLLLEQLSAHIAFIGCNGSRCAGRRHQQKRGRGEIKRAMVRASRRPVVVADGTKLGEVEVARVCDRSPTSISSSPTPGPIPMSWPNIRSAGLCGRRRRMTP